MSAAAPPDALELVRRWDGIGVVSHHDEPTGAWMFVALHDDTLGRPTGGCRMKVYDAPEDGLRDAQRLSEGMTRKWAAVDLPFGGGKAVLAVPRVPTGEVREGLLRRFGALLNSLRGAFSTGEDLGTTPADMLVLSGVTPWVTATDPATGELLDPGPWTALGVHHGILAALADRTGSATLRGRGVLVQSWSRGWGTSGHPWPAPWPPPAPRSCCRTWTEPGPPPWRRSWAPRSSPPATCTTASATSTPPAPWAPR